MNHQVLEILNKKKFSAPEVLTLIVFRVVIVVLFCLFLTFLFWFFLVQDYFLLTLLLGVFFGTSVGIIINTRRVSVHRKNNKDAS